MKRHILTLGGLGEVPVAPGTCGSLGALMCAGVLVMACPPIHVSTAMVAAVLITLGLWSWASDATAELYAHEDPPQVVVDEAAGLFLCFAIAPPVGEAKVAILVVGFGLFRLFDIWKPWPIKESQRMKAGIVVDDLLAGLYAGLVFYVPGVMPFLESMVYNMQSPFA